MIDFPVEVSGATPRCPLPRRLLKRQHHCSLLAQRSAHGRRPFHVFDAREEIRVRHTLSASDRINELLLHPPATAFYRINLHWLRRALAAFAGRECQSTTHRLPQPDSAVRSEYVYVG